MLNNGGSETLDSYSHDEHFHLDEESQEAARPADSDFVNGQLPNIMRIM